MAGMEYPLKNLNLNLVGHSFFFIGAPHKGLLIKGSFQKSLKVVDLDLKLA